MGRSRFLLTALAIAVACRASQPSGPAPSRPVTLAARFDAPVATIDDRYLAVAVDSAEVVGAKFWDPAGSGVQVPVAPYDLARPKLRKLAEQLAPSYLRIGGSEADKVYYDMSDAPGAAPAPYVDVLTRAQWDGVNAFATALGFEVLFTINAGPGPRDAQKKWTPDNARVLLDYTHAKSYPVALWELGNEANAFPIVHGLNFVISGAQLAADAKVARALVDASTPGVRLGAPSSAYWPKAGEFIALYPDFMAAGGGDSLDVITWHYYPQQSVRCPIATRRADPELMFDPATLDEVDTWAGQVEQQRDARAPGKPVWLGETGNAQCGGEPGLSDAFVGGFWWLDELAKIARRGEPVLVRQTLSGSDYGLLDEATLTPRPDYWTSVLWRRLVGARVLDIATNPPDPMARVYAHCTRAGAPGFAPGAVTFVVINLDRANAAALALDALGATDADVYELSASDLASGDVMLNGNVLRASDDGSLPDLPPRATPPAKVRFEPATYGFVVARGIAAAACGGASR
jgi:heparanase 1